MSYYRKAPVYLLGSLIAVATGLCWLLAALYLRDKGAPYVCVGVGTLASWGFVRLKKSFAIGGDELGTRDRRSPVLYLRSFNDDEQFKANNSDGIYFNNSQTFEESLVRALKKLGPVMAIGRPNERLPPLGAARMYVGEDGWQARVDRLIRESRLIVLVLGRTAGLGWEISTVKASGAWSRTLFVFPPTSEPDLMERWTTFRSHADPTRERLPTSISPAVVFATGNPDGTLTLVENRRVKRKPGTAKYRWSSYASSLRTLLRRRPDTAKPDAAAGVA